MDYETLIEKLTTMSAVFEDEISVYRKKASEIYLIDVDKDGQSGVEKKIAESSLDEPWRSDLQKTCEAYWNAKEKLTQINCKLLLVKAMEVNEIDSFDDAEKAVDFARELLEGYINHLKSNEPSATIDISRLEYASEVLMDIYDFFK